MYPEEKQKLDPTRTRKMVLPDDEKMSEPMSRMTELDLDNAWIRQSLGSLHKSVNDYQGIINRNQWLMLVAIGVNTVLVLVLAAMVWAMHTAQNHLIR